MFARFLKDPYFLQNYVWKNSLLLPVLILLVGVFYAFPRNPEIVYWLPLCFLFSSSSFVSILLSFAVSAGLYFFLAKSVSAGALFLEITAGIYVGIWSNVLIHNASHNIIKPKWLNRLVGELAGLQLLSGFASFAVLHMEHHRHSDDPELDPHPTQPNSNLWVYINETRARLRVTFLRMYRDQWGKNSKYMASWKKVKYLLPLNRAYRAALLLVVLGPEAFTFFFIPSLIAIQLVFGVINFYSHVKNEAGEAEIRNLDHNFIFRVLNLTFAGAFYHKNHHLNPRLFNPMKMRSRNA